MSDDAPGLGGQGDDLAPMISSVQTRVIADARGAYLTGNFKALIKQMDDQQRITFRKGVIRFVIDTLHTDILQAAQSRNPDLFAYLSEVDQWLADTTEANQRQINERSRTPGSISAHIPLEAGLRLISLAIVTESPYDFADCAARGLDTAMALPFVRGQVIWSLVKEWYHEAAWCILCSAKLPPHPQISPDRITSLFADAERWYRLRSLGLLIYSLNDEHRESFRRVMLCEALRLITAVPVQVWPDGILPIIEQVRRWHADPEMLTIEAHYEVVNRIESFPETSTSYKALQALVGTFAPTINYDEDEIDLPHVVHLPRLAWETHAITARRSRREKQIVRQTVLDWQIEAAWAILHDTPIPPLELTP
jgi:hypothetical protein